MPYPLSGTMDAALVRFDLGLKYVASEANVKA